MTPLVFSTLAVAGGSAAMESTFAGRIEEGLLLMVVGMGVVFSALVIIGGLIMLMSAVIRRFEERGTAPAAEASPDVAATAYPQTQGADNTDSATAEGIDARTLVLISAAVAAAVGAARVRRITRLSQTATVSAWTDAGRYGLHSHNVRR